MKKERINEINITRALAILGVLIVHATSFPVSELDKSSSLYVVYNSMNTFFRFGTPTFIFLSSLVLFYSYYDRPLTKTLVLKFYKNRLLYIIVPYLVFSVIYYLDGYRPFFPYMTTEQKYSKFFELLIVGEVAPHLYFIFISIQFYILFPILLYIFKKYEGLVKHSIWIGFVVQWAFVLWNHFDLHLSMKGSISLSYFAYYFLGIYVGINYRKVKAYFNARTSDLFKNKYGGFTLLIWGGWLIASISHIILWNQTRIDGVGSHTLVYEFLWNWHTVMSALVLLQASYVIYRRLAKGVIATFSHLGALSFGVYLIHLLVLNVYQRELPMFGDPTLYHLKVVGGFVASLGISWIIVTLAKNYLPYNWILFGSLPKKKKALQQTSRIDTKSSR